MIDDTKLHFANKFLYDRIVEYGLVRIHAWNRTHIESNISMHGYARRKTCGDIPIHSNKRLERLFC